MQITSRIMLVVLMCVFLVGCNNIKKESANVPAHIIIDAKTGLQWVPAPASDTTWFQAQDYVKGLRLGGFSDWRLPTSAELQGLFTNGVDSTTLNVTDKWVWTSEMETGTSNAWYVNFHNGVALTYPRENSYLNRVLAVR
jgi:hypothetical protein